MVRKGNKMIVSRIEKHIINSNNEFYSLLDNFCFKSKNLYNHANYIVRQEFCNTNKWIRYSELDTILKNDSEYPDYRNMPTAQSSQQILRLIDKNWTSFFKSIKDWSKNKDKYSGRPKLPKYKNKNGRNILILTNQNIKLKGEVIYFPKTFKDFSLKPQCINKEDFCSIQQVRFIPRNNYIEVEIVYNIKTKDMIPDNGRYMSIDIGLDNLTAIANNYGQRPFLINGKGLKSINQYYNKIISHYRSIAKQLNKLEYTKRMERLTNKRNFKVEDIIHKSSRYIVNKAIKDGVSVIVIGYNKNWKQHSKMSRKVNQQFVQIPFNTLLQQIQYKANDVGIKVILIEESYTSGTSFLNNELPVKEFYDKKRRIKRGLFKSNNGKLINSDINASYQIMKKEFPNAFQQGYGIEGLVLSPFKVNISLIH